jgi:L-cysteine:1D-myo-inositol 2-amino-2-deoxy-alpha-D-glucopyranoside ligase
MKSWASVEIPKLNKSLNLPPISLTNSKTIKKEVFAKKDVYRMYVCGITPYDSTHLGHAATYLTFDLINRYLRASGSQVLYVQNITDIDDPLLDRAIRDNVNWEELAASQIDLFRGDMENLRVIPPTQYIGAVEAIDLVSEAVTALQAAGSIYAIEADLFFKNYSSSDFGSLSHLDKETMKDIFSQRGGNPILAGKIDPLDCLVWMAKREGEPGWPSVHGVGRPGWHIECTAIALKYLAPVESDETCIDLQGGGSDLIFPHHEMCAAQAQVLTGKELATTYVHAAMIGLDGEKMSKSKGNLVFVSKLINSGTDPMVIRFALMSQHYRLDRMWTDALLADATSRVAKIRQAIASSNSAPTTPLIDRIIVALANDLDTPTALAELDMWASETLQGASGGDSRELNAAIDTLLGLAL